MSERVVRLRARTSGVAHLTPEADLSLQLALHALHYAHQTVCDGMPGNLYLTTMQDIEALTGFRPGHPGQGEHLSNQVDQMLGRPRRFSPPEDIE